MSIVDLVNFCCGSRMSKVKFLQDVIVLVNISSSLVSDILDPDVPILCCNNMLVLLSYNYMNTWPAVVYALMYTSSNPLAPERTTVYGFGQAEQHLNLVGGWGWLGAYIVASL